MCLAAVMVAGQPTDCPVLLVNSSRRGWTDHQVSLMSLAKLRPAALPGQDVGHKGHIIPRAAQPGPLPLLHPRGHGPNSHTCRCNRTEHLGSSCRAGPDLPLHVERGSHHKSAFSNK